MGRAISFDAGVLRRGSPGADEETSHVGCLARIGRGGRVGCPGFGGAQELSRRRRPSARAGLLGEVPGMQAVFAPPRQGSQGSRLVVRGRAPGVTAGHFEPLLESEVGRCLIRVPLVYVESKCFALV